MRSRFRLGAALGGVAATLCLGMGVAAPAGAAVAHSGDAQVVDIDLTVLGLLPVSSDISKVGPLPPEGGYLSESVLTVGDPGITGLTLNAGVAQAVTAGSGYDSVSHAHVADLNLGVTGLVIGATVLQANAKASCDPSTGNVGLTGSSYIAQLRINDQAITVGTDPNQKIVVPGVAEIILNEQATSTSPGAGAITVNALHVKLLDDGLLGPVIKGDIIVSHAHADVTDCPPPPPPPPPGCGKRNQPPCPPPPPPPPCTVKDFITGGGWVIRNGERVSFAVHGGINADGTLRNGGLNIVDHGDGGHRSSHTLTGYRITGATTRELDFDIGTVKVADNGEPGTSDTWQFSGGGYSAGSTTSPIGAGNIQLHQPKGCPSNTGGGGKGGGKPR